MSAVLLGALVCVAPLRGAVAESSDGKARAFLLSLNTRAIEQFSDPSADPAVREQRFRALINEAFDLQTIGRFVLGVHWREGRSTAEERAAFLEAFEDMIVRRFLPLFREYVAKDFVVGKSRRDRRNKQLVFVDSTIGRQKGDPLNLEWRVRERDGRFQILDVVAEGVSLAITLRQEYGPVVKRVGSVGRLVELMREKVGKDAFSRKLDAGD